MNEKKGLNLEKELMKEITTSQPKSYCQEFLDSYFQPKDFEKNGKLYEALGVKLFSKYWINGGSYWTQRSQYSVVRGRTKEDLEHFIATTKLLEEKHLVILPIYFTLIAIPLAHEDYACAAINVMLNVAVNVYPIMSQRYNRNRAIKLKERLESQIIP